MKERIHIRLSNGYREKLEEIQDNNQLTSIGQAIEYLIKEHERSTDFTTEINVAKEENTILQEEVLKNTSMILDILNHHTIMRDIDLGLDSKAYDKDKFPSVLYKALLENYSEK